MKDIERLFDKAMFSVYEKALHECGYNATRFLQMLNEHGGVQTAKILLHSPGLQYGFEALWERGRLDLTVEALVLKSPWNELFTEEERKSARKRLTDLNYNPDNP